MKVAPMADKKGDCLDEMLVDYLVVMMDTLTVEK